MSNPTAANTCDSADTHEHTWGERLQDRLDGDCAGSGDVDAHVAQCAICRAKLAGLEALDRALRAVASPVSLDAGFDERLLRRIDAADEQQRARSRQRLEQEMQQSLQALSRRWKQTLALIVSGGVAGVALTLALFSWLDHSGVSRSLVQEGAYAFGENAAIYVQVAITALVGGTVGLILARWLSTSAD